VLDRYRKAMPYVLALYVVAIAAGFLFFNMRLTVEWVAIILFGAAILSGRAMLFLRDWGVFIVVLLAWQLTSFLATDFPFPWHLHELIDADRWMFFGNVPPQWLQAHLYTPGTLHWWDVLAVTFYMLHFLAPLAAGFVLWIVNRPLFRKYMITYIVVFLGGFATYILYPAVPPWMAGQPLVQVGNQFHFPWIAAKQGYPGGLHAAWAHAHVYLPHTRNLFGDIMKNWYNPYNGTIVFGFLHGHYDQVAAIPSEHAAYPMLFFLFLRRQFGKWGYLALIYIVGLLFSITYLGQHYIIDAIVGFSYAGVGYALVMHAWPAVRRRLHEPATRTAARPLPRPGIEEA
jgi:PAP2 superfamily